MQVRGLVWGLQEILIGLTMSTEHPSKSPSTNMMRTLSFYTGIFHYNWSPVLRI